MKKILIVGVFLHTGLLQFAQGTQYLSCEHLVRRAGTTFDLIVAGAGIGGAITATRYAEAGYQVLLIEAGSPNIPIETEVPAFHATASETGVVALDYGVHHYDDPEQEKRDPKYSPELNGVLYPRGEGIGGSTLVNAMISILPYADDFDESLLKYWTERIERNRNPLYRLMHWVGKTFHIQKLQNPGRHGFDGWLTVSQPGLGVLKDVALDTQLRRIVLETERHVRPRTGSLKALARRALTFFDPNDWGAIQRGEEGLVITPIAVNEKGRRNGVRNFVLNASGRYSNLHILTGALVSKVLLDENKRATGVEVLVGDNQLEADDETQGETQFKATFHAKEGVQVSLGAFETAKLMKLSGIGPRAELEKHGIPVLIDLPGVGENMHDRYEVPVITQLRDPIGLLKDAGFAATTMDKLFTKWKVKGRGLYATNGVVIAMLVKSDPKLDKPDLYIFGVPGAFPGYFEGYSKGATVRKDTFSWIILKARTENRGGQVLLSSADPRAQPDIRFHYFGEGKDRDGNPLSGADEDALVAGVKFIRELNAKMADIVATETTPGPQVSTDAQIRQWVRDIAWGHHVTGTMAEAVHRYAVLGALRLWAVDASIHRNIPGTFIAVPTMMTSEEASDVILETIEKEKARPEGLAP